ncbi:MAG: helix-turn-helix domain-containing protein [Polyangia bacterium]|jgi:hypothetical protein
MPQADRIAFDTYVIDALMPDLVGHDRRASAFVLYLYIWRKTAGATRPAVASLQMMADGTGLAKRSVQGALRVLERRRLVTLRRRSPTAAPSVTLHCHWRT